MKTIFVLVHQDAGQEARLQAALDVVCALDGHLNCLDIRRLPVVVGDVFGMATQEVIEEAEREAEAENRGRIEARLVREGVAWDWTDVMGDMAPTVTALTGLADLIILNRKLDGGESPDMLNLVGSVMLESRKPVLAVPQASRGIDLAGHALVAWDGSSAAANALRAAVPLLCKAERVTFVSILNADLGIPAADAAAYLSRHGIASGVETIPESSTPVHEQLLERCRSLKPDYVVMGGYGHSRLAEALFGGVTKAMLSTSPLPLLLVH